MKICVVEIAGFFEYYTPKIVRIKNRKVGVLNRAIQIAIFLYIFVYVIWINKGYQDFSDLDSAVTAKVKGVFLTNFSSTEFSRAVPNPGAYRRVWDVTDFVVPPMENNAFFITTNLIITANQTRSICPEDPTVVAARCNPRKNRCPYDQPIPLGHGVATGRCVKSESNSTVNTCEVRAWCPVERKILPLWEKNSAILSETSKATVLIKNFVEFKKFRIKRRNVPDDATHDYLRTCRYDPFVHNTCPIFRVRDMVTYSGHSYNEVAVRGAVIAIKIVWSCDLDFDPRRCLPAYRFERLDGPQDDKMASGWNFKYSHYYSDNSRTLFKVYGLRFVILVEGFGGRFSVIPLMLNIGSGLGLLALASVLCDLAVLHLVKKKDLYKAVKYEDVISPKDPRAWQPPQKGASSSNGDAPTEIV